jgi:hypothetical protein
MTASMARAMPHRKDLTGQAFGSLTVIRFSRTDRSSSFWLCRCDCGVERECRSHHLRKGHLRSCGCQRSERVAAVCRLNGAAKFKDDNWVHSIYATYRNSARQRSIEFSLPLDDFRAFIASDCYYCGRPPGNTHDRRTKLFPGKSYVYGGIDRVENASGYVVGNCVPCCRFCNIAKGTYSQTEFLTSVRAIAKRWPK